MRQAAIALVAVAVLVSCQGALAPAATSPPPTTTPTLTPTASPAPTLTSEPTVAPVPTPSPTVEANDPCASSTSDDPATPPEAHIQPTGGGEAIAGRLGSFTYCDIAADALPPRAASLTAVPLADPPQIVLSVADGGEGFVGYRAGYWTAAEWQGDEVSLAANETAAPQTTTQFAGPPSGDWMLAVNLTFASGGSVLYYWHVTVP